MGKRTEKLPTLHAGFAKEAYIDVFSQIFQHFSTDWNLI